MKEPRDCHWKAAIHTLRYIARDPSQGIILNKNASFIMEAYYDSDWAACPHTRRSVSGYYITLGGSPIS